jgi:AraC-like DNA-binding protein
MLREPARDWTLDMLAKASCASRATLARSFGKVAGLAPLKGYGNCSLSRILLCWLLLDCDEFLPPRAVGVSVNHQEIIRPHFH